MYKAIGATVLVLAFVLFAAITGNEDNLAVPTMLGQLAVVTLGGIGAVLMGAGRRAGPKSPSKLRW
jgi:flagellar motor component MotA